ncbi:hypothetical protein SUGI_0861500 [Cryptomeria japonica]|nr:hypothetical protein SUGI_0861500 [Cryptomeria japonica]
MTSTSDTSSHQEVEEFAAASTPTSGGSIMPMKKLSYGVCITHAKNPLGRAIYKELDAVGLKVFVNSEELHLGDEEVEAAIKSSWIYFPIFSED